MIDIHSLESGAAVKWSISLCLLLCLFLLESAD